MHELLQLRIAPIAARCTRDPWPLPLASRTLLPYPSVSSYFRILNRRTVGAITAKLLRIHCGGSVQFIGQNGLVFLLGWSQQVFESMPCLDGHVLVTTLKLAVKSSLVLQSARPCMAYQDSATLPTPLQSPADGCSQKPAKKPRGTSHQSLVNLLQSSEDGCAQRSVPAVPSPKPPLVRI